MLTAVAVLSFLPKPAGFKGAINLNLTGSGGQSFGVFLAGGINVKLVGEANDYVGKGMAGGEIVIVPPADAGFVAEEASIVGNTCLYGATGKTTLLYFPAFFLACYTSSCHD